AAHQVGVALEDALLAARVLEALRDDPDRDTGRAILAGRPVGDRLAAPETAMGQRLVERLGEHAGQAREHLALGSPRQIGAWPAGGQEELGDASGALFGQSLLVHMRTGLCQWRGGLRQSV